MKIKSKLIFGILGLGLTIIAGSMISQFKILPTTIASPEKQQYNNHSKNSDTITFTIQPNFDSAGEYKEGLASVQIDGKWGFINKSGQIVIKPLFDWVGNFSKEHLAAVQIGDKSGFINKQGNFVIKPQFDEVRSFSEGLAAVSVQGVAGKSANGKYGYINPQGNFIIRDFQKIKSSKRLKRQCFFKMIIIMRSRESTWRRQALSEEKYAFKISAF